jgi:Helix-turn-helix domain
VSTTLAKDINAPRLLLTRAEALAALRIGETTLHWLARTRKLNPIRIGARVLFSAAEVERLASRGCSLTEAEKQAATKQQHNA